MCPTEKVKAKKFENPKVYFEILLRLRGSSEMITSKMLVRHIFHV